ncbi:MAG: peptidase M24 [Nitrospinae bacterium CG11_big_fil_rev_8_21_14_0_20_45_15]|nr:MAG: peptidase M24 [Nitrospinae bacterium CG11_big_fil_rev_8_21_14_0_20_45_15]
MPVERKIYSGIFRDGGAGSFAKRRYRKRREELMKKENCLMVIAGVPYGPGGETVWSYAHCASYQEPGFMYLTGINQFNVILILDPGSKESDEILFVSSKDPKKEFWDGVRFGTGDPASEAEVRRVTGIKDVRNIDSFQKVLKERFLKRRKKTLGALWMESLRNGKTVVVKGDHNWVLKQKLSRWVKSWGKGKLVNIMDNHFDLRLPLDKYDIQNTLQAQEITGLAFKETLRHFKNFKSEYELQGFLEGQMLMKSPYGLSFPSIIAGGANAATLHYMKNDDEFAREEMVLMDFGVRWMTMHADISRTVPASGRFNPLQKMLYEIVLNAQIQVEKMACAGVTINHLNEACWIAVNEGLAKKFTKEGGIFKLDYTDRPHGVSHLMGEQEHDGDPFRIYLGKPMQAGWMISNEPGLYGDFKIKLDGKVYDERIGIRIEDNLLIQKKGCLNLSQCVPKKVRDIEKLMLGARDKKNALMKKG